MTDATQSLDDIIPGGVAKLGDVFTTFKDNIHTLRESMVNTNKATSTWLISGREKTGLTDLAHRAADALVLLDMENFNPNAAVFVAFKGAGEALLAGNFEGFGLNDMAKTIVDVSEMITSIRSQKNSDGGRKKKPMTLLDMGISEDCIEHCHENKIWPTALVIHAAGEKTSQIDIQTALQQYKKNKQTSGE
ncbi:MAG: hypothetical protein COB66_08320 [Coxiella sp. (in: Bacteria)]|nr:MAG: hypothetical protein COB66_08320 [Coxiella sp. (in: g-proteobacteria)]